MEKKYILLLTAICSFLFCFVIYEQVLAYDTEAYRTAEVIAEVRNKILSYYVDKVESKQILEGALKGMVSELDPYSSYLDEENYKQLFEGTEGEFIGIGIQITIEGGLPTVITPLDDSPAARAGILPGDKIIEIEGESTDGITLDEVIEKLRGKIGDKVVIKVIHENGKFPEAIEIVRDKIQIVSIKKAQIIDPTVGIGYFRLVKFNKHTKDELRQTLDDLKRQGMQRLIIDLRYNPGGLLDAAVAVSDIFIDKGIIVYTKGRTAGSRKVYEASSRGTYTQLPIAVLVNKGSASASEIVAGALQDYRRAIIVGERTYGKGSVQSILPLRDEKTGVKLTTAKYYTPAGRSIHKEPGKEGGILPDILVLLTSEEQREVSQLLTERESTETNIKDKQLQKAIEILKSRPIAYKFR